MKASYSSITELVLDYFRNSKGPENYDELTSLVLEHFPNSKWKKSHWNWYRNQIKNGKYKDRLTTDVRLHETRSSNKVDTVVKALADPILSKARKDIMDASGGDNVLLFKINRWVYSRLHIDERKIKEPIKEILWNKGSRKCQKCGKSFSTLKNIELHRLDRSLDYKVENCNLLCKPCHIKIHVDKNQSDDFLE